MLHGLFGDYSETFSRKWEVQKKTKEAICPIHELLQSGRARLMTQLQQYLKTERRVDSDEPYSQKVFPELLARAQLATVGVPRTSNDDEK